MSELGIKAALSERLRMERAKKDLNQREVAKRLGMTQATLSNYEKGEAIPPSDVLAKLAEFYNVTSDYLLGISNNRVMRLDDLDDTQTALVDKMVDYFKDINDKLSNNN